MQFLVEHSTVYRYNGAVQLETHTFRLRPRMSTTQRLLMYELVIWPVPAGTAECLDQDGNLALIAWFGAPANELSVHSRFRVELIRTNPFDFLPDRTASRLALWYPEPLATALAPYRDFASVPEPVRQYASEAAARCEWNLLPFLYLLNEQIFHSFRHVLRLEGAPWTSDMTLQNGEGSCRDLAVLFCDACRAMGIAARFVSGYECATAGRADASMHAWSEIYIPGAGWRGYDPSRGLAVTDGHVVVAAGLDPSLAAPIAGLYSGPCGSRMDTYLRMDLEPG